jgi:hypothetical protein
MAYLEQKRYVHCDLAGKVYFNDKINMTKEFLCFKREIFSWEN